MQRAATAGTGSATTTSAPEQLRETLGKNTGTEQEEAAGISGYSNTSLLVRKKPRLDDQVHSASIHAAV